MKICRSELLPALVLSALLPFFSSGCASSPSSGSTTTTTTTTAVTPATVTSIVPAILPVGSAATVVTVTGSNFLSSSVVQVAGVSQPSTYVSSTSIQATVPPSLLAVASLLPIAVLNGTTTSATGAAVNLEIDNPAPVVSSFSPTSLVSGITGVPLVIAGTGFVATSSGQIGGTPRPTTYVSPTQISVALSAADVAAAGGLSLKIVNPSPGGGTSADSSIPVNNAVPAGLVLTPSTGIVGAAATTITVAGTGFYPGSVVKVNGIARATTYVDITHLTFQLTVADQAAVATLAVSVTNPPAGGGSSASVSLLVSLPTATPVIATVSPTQFIVSSAASTISITGTGFTTKTIAQWNGTALVTGYYLTSNGLTTVVQLVATVPSSLLAATGTASITVNSPTASPATSNAVSVTISNPPVPTVTSISPNSSAIGVAVPITVYGTSFTGSSVISFNGTNLTTTYVNSTALSATVPASAIATPGNGSITVTTPAPGGGTSAAQAFTGYVAIVNNSGIYNPANGLFYVSVPSSVGAPYGNSVVSVDPATGALGTPIPVGSEPNKLALSSDGTILWVGLDGASAIRQVNLTTGVAGQQFTIGTASIYSSATTTALALAALPGAPNSVVVSLSNPYYTNGVAIYDSGVLRGSSTSTTYYNNGGVALQVDGSKQEIYSGSSNGYYVFTYNSSGVTAKTSVTTSSYANTDELQITGGNTYTDVGKVFDAESGSLLGTFYSSASLIAAGPAVIDPTLAKAFILDYTTQYSYLYNQIQVFNTSDYTLASTSVIPVNGLGTSYTTGSVSHLARWGTNGLVFRATNGVFSVRSNLVKDLSTTVADLGLTIAATGGTTTGSSATYTATVKNAGSAGATNVSFTGLIPSSAILSSITTTQGSCALATTVSCNLGALANGASATIKVNLTLATSGTTTFSGQVSGSETDNNVADNQASSSITVTGTAYNPVPAITTLTPAAVQAGASDTTIAIAGTNFNSSTVAYFNGTALTTSVSSTNLLSVVVPAANLKTLGWGAITVAAPTPGGGTSAVLPLSIFNVVTLGVNHIIYDPFSRKLFASVGSGSSSVTGNSIAPITPETGTIGTTVAIGSQPTALALSSSGSTLYVSLKGSNNIARLNMLTQVADGPYSILPVNTAAVGPTTMDVQPGSETAVAFEQPNFTIYDFNTTAKTASPRTVTTGYSYSNSSPRFLNATTLYGYYSSGLERYDVSPTTLATGYQAPYISTLNRFGPFKIDRSLAFANAGGVADLTTSPATPLGYYPPITNYYYYSQIVAPDTSLGRVFFLTGTTVNSSSLTDGIVAYNQTTFLPTGIMPLNMAVIEGNTSYTGVDLVRWGQDGLAALTSGGHIYILRGPAVVPQLLNQNPAATLTSATPGNVASGAGNTILSLTGSGFIQGAATTWNGSYRTTTWVDSSHLTIAIPASDLAAAGTATLVVTNPGATASGSITFTVN